MPVRYARDGVAGEEGTGLGLATVHGIVKQSGGHIGVQSEPGQGTTFKIYLRPAASSEEEAPPAPAVTDLSRGSETVLLVEDEASVRELGSRPSTGSSSRAAATLELSQAHGAPIHLLVTDMVMPEMGGRELKPFTIEGLSRKVREVLDRINPAPPPGRPPRG